MKNGYCKCGCNNKTEIAERTRNDRGWVIGKPKNYIKGHSPMKGKNKYSHLLNLKKSCVCGCEQEINSFTKKGVERFYKKGHRTTKKIIFNKEQEQILLGSLLGDGHIQQINVGYTYSDKHSSKQKEYLLWKNKFLNFNFGYYKTVNQYYLKKGNKSFKHYRELFYPNGKKIVTREILNKLEPLGLAVWFMDDGSYNYRNKSIAIYTNGFNFVENKIIQQYFKERWSIDCRIQKINQKVTNISFNRKEGINYVLRFNVEETKKLTKIIESYITQIPSMIYKIGLDEERIKITKEKIKNYSKLWYARNYGKRYFIKEIIGDNKLTQKIYDINLRFKLNNSEPRYPSWVLEKRFIYG